MKFLITRTGVFCPIIRSKVYRGSTLPVGAEVSEVACV